MPDIDHRRLRRLDLTVLLIFAALMRHRKATRVAEELGLTQSSISHALKRLREVFGDELFLRRPHGLEPTAVAEALERPVRGVIETLAAALEGPPAFEPATFRGTVRIGAFDSEQATLLPALLRRAATEAPGLRISARAVVRAPALAALAAGELDLALGYFWDLPDDLLATPLMTETYAVVAPPGHPWLAGGATLQGFVTARHVVVSSAGDLAGIVDGALAARGLRREVVAAVPQFFPAFATVAATGCLATLPRRLAEAYAPAFGLVATAPPLTLRPFTVAAVRHKRDAKNPLHAWLIAALTPAEPSRVP